MRRATMAPALQEFIRARDTGTGTSKQAASELRALLAVVKEATAAEILHPMHHTGAAPKQCAGCRLMRALSRLDKLSTAHRQ